MSIAAKYRPHYTYDDYCQWEGQWELIEGMPYAMSPAPIPAHQRVNSTLIFEFEFERFALKIFISPRGFANQHNPGFG